MIENFIEAASILQSPSDLGALFNEYSAPITKHDLYNKPENQVLIEAWMAVMLGLGFERGSGEDVQVRLCRERFPDFQLMYGGHDLAFEATLAILDTPLGKPGIAYRGDKSLGPIRSGKRIVSPQFDYGPVEIAVLEEGQ